MFLTIEGGMAASGQIILAREPNSFQRGRGDVFEFTMPDLGVLEKVGQYRMTNGTPLTV